MTKSIKTVVSSDSSLRIRTVVVEDCEPYVDCDNKHESLESLFKRAVVKLPDGTYALQVCYGAAPEPLALELTWDDIANVPVADATSVSDWNTFFDLPTNGVSFSSVTVDGNTVKLYGGSGITLKNGLFSTDYDGYGHITSIDDKAECIIGAEQNAFGDYNNATNGTILESVSLPVIETVGLYCFSYGYELLTIYMPLVEVVGEGAFNSCPLITELDLPLCTTIGNYACDGCYLLTEINLPNVISIGNSCFQNSVLISINISSCTSLGTTTGDNSVFNNITGNTIAVTCHASLLTCNGGSPDGDLCYLHDNNTITVNGAPLVGCP